MKLEFEKTELSCLKQIVREVRNQEQTQEVRLPEGFADIGRIISAWGQVSLRSKQWDSDAMSATGGVTAWILYTPEDETEVQCIETWIPFHFKWDFPETDREGIIHLTPRLRFMDARTASARKLVVRAGVAVLGEAYQPQFVEFSQPGEIPEQVQILRNTYPVQVLQKAGEKTFELDEELTLPASCPNVDKLIRYELDPQISDRKILAGKVVFRGNCAVHLLYLTGEGETACWNFEVPFSQFGDLEDESDPDGDIKMTLAVTGAEVDVTETGDLHLKCGIVAQYLVCDRINLELAQDAYGLNCSVVPAVQELEMPSVLDNRTETLCAEQSIQIDCSKILDVCFLPDLPRCNQSGDPTSWELSGVFQVLYLDMQGQVQNGSARWEQTYEVKAVPEEQLLLNMEAEGQPQTLVNGDGLTFRQTTRVNLLTVSSGGMEMMTGMEVGEVSQPEANRPSLVICRADGERLWNTAKKCGSTVEAIRQANHLQEDPREGQMLLIPIS